jgi:high-affinity nickel permease
VRRWARTLSRREWLRLSGFAGAVAALHVAGWGLFLYYSRSQPALAGLGTLAYFFRLIDRSWHMYPLGVLFGLGFDTATEVGR